MLTLMNETVDSAWIGELADRADQVADGVDDAWVGYLEFGISSIDDPVRAVLVLCARLLAQISPASEHDPVGDLAATIAELATIGLSAPAAFEDRCRRILDCVYADGTGDPASASDGDDGDAHVVLCALSTVFVLATLIEGADVDLTGARRGDPLRGCLLPPTGAMMGRYRLGGG